MTQTPTIGRIVHYKLAKPEAIAINQRRGDFIASPPQNSGLVAHVGNSVAPGDVFPAMIVRVWSVTAGVQLQVFLDGNDTLWATSVCHARDSPLHDLDRPHPERTYIWPPRV